jgi:competence protein ComEA
MALFFFQVLVFNTVRNIFFGKSLVILIIPKLTAMQTDVGKNFLTFTKKEKRGTLVLLATIVGIFISSKYLYPLIIKEDTTNNKAIFAAADSLKEKQNGSPKNYYSRNEYDDNSGYHAYPKKQYDNTFIGTMFYFDPNTLGADGWRKLGVRDKTIASMQKYITKGGRFREPDDLRKVWGLRDDEKDRLVPYVRIEGGQEKTHTNYSSNYQPYEKKVYEKKTIAIVDINAGDSAAYDGLPSIGAGFSRRIIKFRDKLGGFYKVEQVGETFGLPDSVFQKIKPYLKINGDNIHKININTATEEELKLHPYIRWQLAKVITEYRKQHGNYKALEELKKIMLINEETYSKISPYLTL